MKMLMTICEAVTSSERVDILRVSKWLWNSQPFFLDQTPATAHLCRDPTARGRP